MVNADNISIVMGIWVWFSSLVVYIRYVMCPMQDTAGSERYQSMTKMYYRSAKAAILCYDLCDAVSFKKLDYWVKELKDTEPVSIFRIVDGCVMTSYVIGVA